MRKSILFKVLFFVIGLLPVCGYSMELGAANLPSYAKGYVKPTTPGYIEKCDPGHRKGPGGKRIETKEITIKFTKSMSQREYDRFMIKLKDIIHEADRAMLLGCLKKSNFTHILFSIRDYVTIEQFQKFLDRANRELAEK